MTDFLTLPRQLGRYTLVRQLGRGGMGVVYVAHDDRLSRDVAVKMIAGLSDDSAIQRFWREARAAASVSHPNVCQVYEVDEAPEGIFLAMELLEGESLEARLTRGACPPAEAVRVALEVLAALGALHARGLVHRDVKPSNVFLTAHGAKLLDFGLARASADHTLDFAAGRQDITEPGMVMGTPRYMAPEQLDGGGADARADVYATGALLFEMLAGRPAFAGANMIALIYTILHEHPPALQGPAEVIAIDRVIRRALSKEASARYQTVEAMAAELRSAPQTGSGTVTPVRALTRVVVPPLRLLRPEPDVAFLSFGLADAISGSLSGLRDVVVRSPTLIPIADSRPLDLRRVAAEADVDLIVLGSLLSVGNQIRATVQLVDARSGTVLGAKSVLGAMADIFQLEDHLSRAVMELLAPQQSSDTVAVRNDRPAAGRAFEYFLRGIEHARELKGTREARDWFERVLEEDPAFAPAWAWLGRCYRIIGKYEEDREGNARRAEEAFRRALALSPNLPVAHRYLTHLEAEEGRADAAIARLLDYAKVNRNDAQLFAGLVHACRYVGLNAASLAAHEEARRLDPTVPTSYEYTLLMAGEVDRLRGLRRVPGTDRAAVNYSLLFGQVDADTVSQMSIRDADRLPGGFRLIVEAVRVAVTGSRSEAVAALDRALMGEGGVAVVGDPEAVFLSALVAARTEDRNRTLELLERAVGEGFAPVDTLENAPLLAFVREEPRFRALVDAARQRRQVGLAIFERNGGGALLGLAPGHA